MNDFSNESRCTNIISNDIENEKYQDRRYFILGQFISSLLDRLTRDQYQTTLALMHNYGLNYWMEKHTMDILRVYKAKETFLGLTYSDGKKQNEILKNGNDFDLAVEQWKGAIIAGDTNLAPIRNECPNSYSYRLNHTSTKFAPKASTMLINHVQLVETLSYGIAGVYRLTARNRPYYDFDDDILSLYRKFDFSWLSSRDEKEAFDDGMGDISQDQDKNDKDCDGLMIHDDEEEKERHTEVNDRKIISLDDISTEASHFYTPIEPRIALPYHVFYPQREYIYTAALRHAFLLVQLTYVAYCYFNFSPGQNDVLSKLLCSQYFQTNLFRTPPPSFVQLIDIILSNFIREGGMVNNSILMGLLFDNSNIEKYDYQMNPQVTGWLTDDNVVQQLVQASTSTPVDLKMNQDVTNAMVKDSIIEVPLITPHTIIFPLSQEYSNEIDFQHYHQSLNTDSTQNSNEMVERDTQNEVLTIQPEFKKQPPNLHSSYSFPFITLILQQYLSDHGENGTIVDTTHFNTNPGTMLHMKRSTTLSSPTLFQFITNLLFKHYQPINLSIEKSYAMIYHELLYRQHLCILVDHNFARWSEAHMLATPCWLEGNDERPDWGLFFDENFQCFSHGDIYKEIPKSLFSTQLHSFNNGTITEIEHNVSVKSLPVELQGVTGIFKRWKEQNLNRFDNFMSNHDNNTTTTSTRSTSQLLSPLGQIVVKASCIKMDPSLLEQKEISLISQQQLKQSYLLWYENQMSCLYHTNFIHISNHLLQAAYSAMNIFLIKERSVFDLFNQARFTGIPIPLSQEHIQEYIDLNYHQNDVINHVGYGEEEFADFSPDNPHHLRRVDCYNFAYIQAQLNHTPLPSNFNDSRFIPSLISEMANRYSFESPYMLARGNQWLFGRNFVSRGELNAPINGIALTFWPQYFASIASMIQDDIDLLMGVDVIGGFLITMDHFSVMRNIIFRSLQLDRWWCGSSTEILQLVLGFEYTYRIIQRRLIQTGIEKTDMNDNGGNQNIDTSNSLKQKTSFKKLIPGTHEYYLYKASIIQRLEGSLVTIQGASNSHFYQRYSANHSDFYEKMYPVMNLETGEGEVANSWWCTDTTVLHSYPLLQHSILKLLEDLMKLQCWNDNCFVLDLLDEFPLLKIAPKAAAIRRELKQEWLKSRYEDGSENGNEDEDVVNDEEDPGDFEDFEDLFFQIQIKQNINSEKNNPKPTIFCDDDFTISSVDLIKLKLLPELQVDGDCDNDNDGDDDEFDDYCEPVDEDTTAQKSDIGENDEQEICENNDDENNNHDENKASNRLHCHQTHIISPQINPDTIMPITFNECAFYVQFSIESVIDLLLEAEANPTLRTILYNDIDFTLPMSTRTHFPTELYPPPASEPDMTKDQSSRYDCVIGRDDRSIDGQVELVTITQDNSFHHLHTAFPHSSIKYQQTPNHFGFYQNASPFNRDSAKLKAFIYDEKATTDTNYPLVRVNPILNTCHSSSNTPLNPPPCGGLEKLSLERQLGQFDTMVNGIKLMLHASDHQSHPL